MPAVADPPDQVALDLIEQLKTLDGLMQDATYTTMSNAALIGQAGLTDVVRPGDFLTTAFATPRPPSEAEVVVALMNMRLALTPLTQAFGADDNTVVMGAQAGSGQPGAPSTAISVRAGDATLADIRSFLGDTGAGPVVLRMPLIILGGASLTLEAGEELALSRTDGAFIVNFGHLSLRGATISAQGEANAVARAFRPFVTTTDTGTVELKNARLIGLGFGETLKFSGFSILRSILSAPARPSQIEDSTFSDLVTVAISGDTDMVMRGNRFQDMRSAALTILRTQGARILSNVFFGQMPTNAIRFQDGSSRGLIAGNIILGGDRAGITVRGNSLDVTIARNIIWDRDGGGIAMVGSDCGRIFDNLVIQNGQKGIEVRTSIGTELHRNTIFSNHNAGIWISAQPDGAETRLIGNVISFNGAGLAGADTESIFLDGNNFSQQYQQFLSGDLAPLSAVVAEQMRGLEPFLLRAGGQPVALDTPTETTVCSD
jgi:poly(beta-D-mannuronate) C5 epimerase